MRADALLSKRSIELSRDAGIGVRDDCRARLEQADTTTKVGEYGGDLAPRISRPHDGGCCRQNLEGSNVVVGEGKLAPGDGQSAGVSADGQDDPLGPPTASIACGQCVRVGIFCFCCASQTIGRNCKYPPWASFTFHLLLSFFVLSSTFGFLSAFQLEALQDASQEEQKPSYGSHQELSAD